MSIRRLQASPPRPRARGLARPPERDRWARAAALSAALLAAGCAGAPDEAGRKEVCERALLALEPDGTRVLAAGREPVGGDRYTLRFATPDGRVDALTCRFAPDALGRPGLVGLASAAGGEVSPGTLFLLQTYVLARGQGGDAGDALGRWPYLAQQLVNATAPCAIYALLALGYSLLYGLIGRVNLAFGEFCALGTVAALAGALAAGGDGSSAWRTAAGALAAVLPLGLALGAAAHAVVLRPLLRRTSLAFLVASLGLSLALAEGLRLAQGNRPEWFPPGLASVLPLWRSAEGAVVAVSTGQLLIAAIAAAVFALTLWAMRRTAFGRAWRACADDPGAAALVGVDIDRTVRRSTMLASTCAVLAGAMVSLHYGVVGPDAGVLLGFKALTAAVVGGIGSPAGAALGGLAIGLGETLWAAYLPGNWRDVAVFGVLALTLALRPHGFLGLPQARDNPMLWRARDPGPG